MSFWLVPGSPEALNGMRGNVGYPPPASPRSRALAELKTVRGFLFGSVALFIGGMLILLVRGLFLDRYQLHGLAKVALMFFILSFIFFCYVLYKSRCCNLWRRQNHMNRLPREPTERDLEALSIKSLDPLVYMLRIFGIKSRRVDRSPPVMRDLDEGYVEETGV